VASARRVGVASYSVVLRALRRVENTEISPEALSKTYPIELFTAFFRNEVGFESCLKEAMKELGLISNMARKVKPLEGLPEGLRDLLLVRAFEIHLNRMIGIIAWLYKTKTPPRRPLIEKIEKAVNLPPELACELLRDEVEAAKNKKRLSSRVVKISLLMGMKAYLFWNRYYGLTIPREPEPELEYSESYQPCLAHELASSF